MIPFDFRVALKVLVFYLVVNLIILPIVLSLKLNLLWSYYLIFSFEGLCTIIIGFLLIFQSLFSTIEVEAHEYVGDGFSKYQLRPVEISKDKRKNMRRRGITMIIIGFLLITLLGEVNYILYFSNR